AGAVGHYRAVVNGALLARVGVVVGTKLVEGAVDVVGTELLVTLEEHVLEEVRYAGNSGRLVARTRVHDVTHRGGGSTRVVLADHDEAVLEHDLIEAQGGALHAFGSNVTTVGSGMGLA